MNRTGPRGIEGGDLSLLCPLQNCLSLHDCLPLHKSHNGAATLLQRITPLRGMLVLLPRLDIRHKRPWAIGARSLFYWWRRGIRVCFASPFLWHTTCSVWFNDLLKGASVMFANPLFWDTKIRLAILTLATFAALC